MVKKEATTSSKYQQESPLGEQGGMQGEPTSNDAAVNKGGGVNTLAKALHTFPKMHDKLR